MVQLVQKLAFFYIIESGFITNKVTEIIVPRNNGLSLLSRGYVCLPRYNIYICVSASTDMNAHIHMYISGSYAYINNEVTLSCTI